MTTAPFHHDPVLPDDPVAAIMLLAKSAAGIDFDARTRSVVEGRLAKRLRLLSCDMTGYLALLGKDPTELVICIDLLTTHHTYWFREPEHFADLQRRVLPAAILRGRRMRIWCTAAGSGEEPYSIALCLLRTLPKVSTWDCTVMSTDISSRALARASEGLYCDDRIAHLGPQDRKLALDLADKGPPRIWRVKPALLRLVQLARLNLIDRSWPMHVPFDVIFCRNVLPYFDLMTQERILNRLADMLVPGGTLYVGHHEHLPTIPPTLRLHAPAIYVKA